MTVLDKAPSQWKSHNPLMWGWWLKVMRQLELKCGASGTENGTCRSGRASCDTSTSHAYCRRSTILISMQLGRQHHGTEFFTWSCVPGVDTATKLYNKDLKLLTKRGFSAWKKWAPAFLLRLSLSYGIIRMFPAVYWFSSHLRFSRFWSTSRLYWSPQPCFWWR